MSGIKYYQLTKGEELPDEFCAVKDVDGEPSEYTFYVPEAENAKLKELAKLMHETIKDLQETFDASVVVGGVELSAEYFETELNKLGIEVDG